MNKLLSDDLKPCPMCGDKAASNTIKYSPSSEQARLNGQRIFYGVNCISCGLDNRGLLGYKTPEAAAEAWNTCALAHEGREAVSVPVHLLNRLLRADPRFAFSDRDKAESELRALLDAKGQTNGKD